MPSWPRSCLSGTGWDHRLEAHPAIGRPSPQKRIQPELAVVRLARPSLDAGISAEGYQQQDTCRVQDLDQAVEHRLCLTVDPVQVLEDQEQLAATCFRSGRCRTPSSTSRRRWRGRASAMWDRSPVRRAAPTTPEASARATRRARAALPATLSLIVWGLSRSSTPK